MWSEEELRDIPDLPPTRRTGAKSLASALRQTLAARPVATPHELTRSSVIHTPSAQTHGNFVDAAYRRILANPAWAARLGKAHTARRQARPMGPDESIRPWRELDASTSSDALLMNIFCYPRVLTPRLRTLLGVPASAQPEFGHHPRIELEIGRSGHPLQDRTEIDMRLGPLLVEAKLTESNFQTAPLRLLERYPNFRSTFDPDLLESSRRGVHSYQLVRGVLAAQLEARNFAVLLDARRPDLIEAWYLIIRAVRSFELQSQLRLLTWQELAPHLPRPLQLFLAEKYSIE